MLRKPVKEIRSNKEKIAEIWNIIDEGRRRLRVAQQKADAVIKPRRFYGATLLEKLRLKNSSQVTRLEQEGKIPPRRQDGGVKFYLLEDLIEAMDALGVRPGRKVAYDDAPRTLSVTNFKGGVWKSTTLWNFAAWLGYEGLRILVIDVDPQGTVTRNFGIMSDDETDADTSLASLIKGEKEITEDNVRGLIRPTNICTVDILPAALDLQETEWKLAADLVGLSYQEIDSETRRLMELRSFYKVRSVVAKVKNDYDIILIDGTPTLGLLPLNIVFAADSVIVPVPTERPDFCSTMSFLEMLVGHFEFVDERFGDKFTLPELRYLPTRFAAGRSPFDLVGPEGQESDKSKKYKEDASQLILDTFHKPSFKDRMIQAVIRKHDAVIGRLGTFSKTIFEVNPNERGVKKSSRENAIDNFTEAFQLIFDEEIAPYWPSLQQDHI